MLDQQQTQLLTEKPAALDWAHLQTAPPMMMGANLNELDESNLLEMMQLLTRRRDELRLIDKQLFDLTAECFIRLKPVETPGRVGSNSCRSDSSGSNYGDAPSLAGSLDDGAIDLTRLAEVQTAETGPSKLARGQPDCSEPDSKQKQQQERVSSGKRPPASSPSLHFKKQRLLSAIISTDDIGEKQQVLAEKELDVRNEPDGTRRTNSNTSDEQPQHQQQQQQQHQQPLPQSSLKLIACNSSYQQQTTTATIQQNQAQDYNHLFNEAAAVSAANSFAVQQLHFERQFDSGNTSSASDQDDDNQAESNERPQLKKFCSIGTAEMSFERFSRQQNLIDSTLATLTSGASSLASTKLGHMQLQPAPQPPSLPLSAQSNCFGIELNKTAQLQPGPIQTSPMMMVMPAQRPDLMHQLYDQFMQQPHQLPLAAFSGAAAAASQPQPPVYGQVAAPLHQRQHQCLAKPTTTTTTTAGVALERLLLNAKEFGPIVRKMSFRCHVCSSCFEDRHRLQQHLSIHLNLHPSWFEEKTIRDKMDKYETRRGDYLCQACELRFETTSEFDRHMHRHGEKPHQCEFCTQDNKSVSFRYFRQLLTHLRSHCFLYSCRFVPECRQTANRKDYLKLHILKHHLNNKLPEAYTLCCH